MGETSKHASSKHKRKEHRLTEKALARDGSARLAEAARKREAAEAAGERPPNDALISPPHPRRKSDARRTERKTIEKARKAKREGKAPTTQAGEYVRVEKEKIRRGEHGARSPEQAIAIVPGQGPPPAPHCHAHSGSAPALLIS